MNYGLYYKEVSFNRQAMQVVNTALSGNNFKWEESRLYNQKNQTRRQSCMVGRKMNHYPSCFKDGKSVNRSAGWNLNIGGVEPVQFGYT